jgi:hypothetical protein
MLNSFSWIIRGIGGVIGSLTSAVFTQYFHPKWCILIYSILGFFITYTGLILNPEIDKEGLLEMKGFFKDLKRSIYDIWEIRRIP